MTELQMSAVPLVVGTWQLDQRSWRAIPEKDVARAIDRYLAQGVRQFDTADIYGRSEALLGRLLKGEPCQISTKTFFFGGLPTAQQVRLKIENSLNNLQRETLDCVHVHWHHPELDCRSTFEVLVQLMEQGKIRQLGVTNFNLAMLEKALAIAPITSHQVQYNLVDRRVEAAMVDFCRDNAIAIQPYGPLAGGFLSNRYVGITRPHPAADHAQSFYYSSMIEAHGGWPQLQAMLDVMLPIAQKHHLTVAQVALSWLWQQPGITAVISGLTLDRLQIEQNIQAAKIQLPAEDLATLTDKSDQLFDQTGEVYAYERADPSLS